VLCGGGTGWSVIEQIDGGSATRGRKRKGVESFQGRWACVQSRRWRTVVGVGGERAEKPLVEKGIKGN